MNEERDMAIVDYMEYAKSRARWWASKHPYLREDIMATAMLALVKAFDQRVPQTPKAFVSAAVNNAVKDLLTRNSIIYVPWDEIKRRKEAKESLATLPSAHCDGECRDTPDNHSPPTWMEMQADDVASLLELTDREHRILELKIDGYTNAEIGLEFDITEGSVRHALGKIQGRYLTLLHNHKGLLKPHG